MADFYGLVEGIVENKLEDGSFEDLLEELGSDVQYGSTQAKAEDEKERYYLPDFTDNAAMISGGIGELLEVGSDEAPFGHPSPSDSQTTDEPDYSPNTSPVHCPSTSSAYCPSTSSAACYAKNPAYSVVPSLNDSKPLLKSSAKPTHAPVVKSETPQITTTARTRSIYRGVSKTSKHRWGAKYSSKRVSSSCTTEVEAALHYDKYLQEHQRDKHLQLANFCPCCQMFQNPLKLACVKSECTCSSQRRENSAMVAKATVPAIYPPPPLLASQESQKRARSNF
jgi:hypothetical protein